MNNNSIKEYVKNHLDGMYGFARSVRNGIRDEKSKRESQINDTAIHYKAVDINSEIKVLYSNQEIKRLNIIFDVFDQNTINDKMNADFLGFAIDSAVRKKYELRIISRNNLPNPQLFVEFAGQTNRELPEKYSFYSDSANRVSSAIYALEMTKGDYVFTSEEINRLKDWSKNGQ